MAAHLHALAREPRPAGSAAAAAARRYCAEVLTSLEFDVAERSFQYSAAVGELGTPAAGATMLALIVAAAVACSGGLPVLAIGMLLGGGILLVFVGEWAARRGVLAIPIRRRHGVNLEARRAGAAPRAWLVAHIDSKSQPVSLVVRAAGIMVLALAWIVATALAIISALHREPRAAVWNYVLLGAALGAIPVIASLVGRRSQGAVDNASGVATVLAAAELASGSPVGVLITDAEELGLAGARAWCAASAGEQVPVLNCDGVDDAGVLTLMWTRPRSVSLEQAVRSAAAAVGAPLRVIPLIPGVLVDGLAFADAGREVVTLSRGSIETLRRIHTRRDDLERLHGVGVAVAARVLAGAIRLIVEQR